MGKINITADNKCSFCSGTTCCSYFTQQVDTPRSKADFQTLLWQIAHEKVELYQDEDGWFLIINNRCHFLEGDGRCGIYEQRPTICREHDNEWCEYDELAEKHFKRHFTSYQALLKYCKKRFKRWDG
ncbi:MAG: YkgJ family cysteine cluster protein [Gammaproteobacteria bacterium]|nr:YkgJ family cysteine cluster protein [Gammaproteobacteria bacterium]MBT7308229.1 YkgJ family cysteine cluster protein [Gammaproteobacteria bacterium]